MDLILILLCTAVGTIVGTIAGIAIMQRRIRLPATEAELAVARKQLIANDAALSSANGKLEERCRQLAEKDQVLQQSVAELAAKQHQLEEITGQAETYAGKVQGLEAKIVAFDEERRTLESTIEDVRAFAGAAARSQVATLEAQLEAEKRQVQDMAQEVVRVTAEAAGSSKLLEDESARRASLEAELSLERERSAQLAARVAELEREHDGFDAVLTAERQAAAQGMELLSQAQDHLQSLFRVLGANGNGNGHAPAAAALVVESTVEATQEAQPALLQS